MILFMFQIISNIAHFCCIIIIVIIKSLLLLLLLPEVIGPKDLPIKQVCRPGGTLIQAIKQSCPLCSLTVHMFKAL